MNFSSKLLEGAVDAFSSLPGVGRKTALRLVLHLLKQDPSKSNAFAEALLNCRNNIKECKQCHNLSDEDICTICSNPVRSKETICVVENIRDVMAIEETGQFKGLYHVLGGVISPLEGITPGDLNISSLQSRLMDGQCKELIMAISPTIEGETTIYYICKNIGPEIEVSLIARGVSFGGELEYADELTLGRSIASRTPYRITQE
ncbi:MAG: recombination mediator RecR [Bacteroidota bacterium]